MEEWWDEQTLAVKILVGIGFGILGIGLLFLGGLVVMLLWNWLMPKIFGLTSINYWEAWGLLLLSSILFKNFGGSGSDSGKDRRRKKHLKRILFEEEACKKAAGEMHANPKTSTDEQASL